VEKHEAIHTLYALHDPVCKVLRNISQLRGTASSEASAFLTSLTNDEFVVSLCVLNYVMTVTKQLSIALQSASSDLISAVNHVRQIREQLQSIM
jgi:hypothetical protein